MSNLRQRLHKMVAHAQIAGYQRRQLAREVADRNGQEHLDRSRAGIKDYPRV